MEGTRMRRRLSMDLMERMIEDGEGWVISHRMSVDDGNNADLLISVPADEELHLFGHVTCEGKAWFEMRTDSSASDDGTEITIRNKLFGHTTTIASTAYYSPTLTQQGTVIISDLCPVAGKYDPIGPSPAMKDFLILTAGKHLIRMTNKSGGAASMGFNLSVMRFPITP